MASLDHLFLLKEIAMSILTFLITHLTIRSHFTNRHNKLPPGPRGWPIIGALSLLGSMPHVTLSRMAKKYARAFLKTLDQNFSNKPPNAGATHLAYDSQDMVFAHYGSRWKLLRKLSNLHMLGGKALDEWAQVREK
ncbi:hypothetical protein JHK87_055336 [Glycine soja]|nr:hypothetical protein JHK87_055336 [Glycine soja]